MNETARWLDVRLPPMPPALRRAVDAALAARAIEYEGASGGVVGGADRLADAGLAALARAAHGASDRAGAAELLVADALLTYACEAAAEEGAEVLDGVLERLELPRFAAVLGDTGS